MSKSFVKSNEEMPFEERKRWPSLPKQFTVDELFEGAKRTAGERIKRKRENLEQVQQEGAERKEQIRSYINKIVDIVFADPKTIWAEQFVSTILVNMNRVYRECHFEIKTEVQTAEGYTYEQRGTRRP